MYNLATLRIAVRTDYGELSVEGDSLEDLVQAAEKLGISQGRINRILADVQGDAKVAVTSNLPGTTQPSPSVFPGELVSKLSSMTPTDIVTTLLYYKGPILTKSELLSQSAELGKELEPNWLDKNFARDTKGLVTQTKTTDGKPGYKLSDQGNYKTRLRIEELSSSNP